MQLARRAAARARGRGDRGGALRPLRRAHGGVPSPRTDAPEEPRSAGQRPPALARALRGHGRAGTRVLGLTKPGSRGPAGAAARGRTRGGQAARGPSRRTARAACGRPPGPDLHPRSGHAGAARGRASWAASFGRRGRSAGHGQHHHGGLASRALAHAIHALARPRSGGIHADRGAGDARPGRERAGGGAHPVVLPAGCVNQWRPPVPIQSAVGPYSSFPCCTMCTVYICT
mmetsp:Transcript_86867/g.281285  ORF Transcript_86867/g.281285 Transcript_86867/m.281285 type:complete len:231 (+) Transcript_86867:237-929(+)